MEILDSSSKIAFFPKFSAITSRLSLARIASIILVTSAMGHDFIALIIAIADSFSLVNAVVLLLVVDLRLRPPSKS